MKKIVALSLIALLKTAQAASASDPFPSASDPFPSASDPYVCTSASHQQSPASIETAFGNIHVSNEMAELLAQLGVTSITNGISQNSTSFDLLSSGHSNPASLVASAYDPFPSASDSLPSASDPTS